MISVLKKITKLSGNDYHVHGSPVNSVDRYTFAKCISNAPIACLDVS